MPENGVEVTATLEEDIKQLVKQKLEAHAYPREIQFLKEMPMTDTGKIMRSKLQQIDSECSSRRAGGLRKPPGGGR